MKNNIKILSCLAIIAAVVGFKWQQSMTPTFMSPITVANIEALTLANIEEPNIDLEEIEIRCSSGRSGHCFIETFEPMKMCGEHMYRPCMFSGYADDYCYSPC